MSGRARMQSHDTGQARRKISKTELHALLERKFRSTAADQCLKCRVPMPVFVESSTGATNWRLGRLDECTSLCHSILDDIAEKLAEQYELKR
jgi:hypothetical protein